MGPAIQGPSCPGQIARDNYLPEQDLRAARKIVTICLDAPPFTSRQALRGRQRSMTRSQQTPEQYG